MPSIPAVCGLDAMVEHPILVIVVIPQGVKLRRPSETVLDLLGRKPASFTKESGGGRWLD